MSQAKLILEALNFPSNQYDRTAAAASYNNASSKVVAGSSVLALLLTSKNLFFYSSLVPYFCAQKEAFVGSTASLFLFQFLVDHCSSSMQFSPALYFPSEFEELLIIMAMMPISEKEEKTMQEQTKILDSEYLQADTTEEQHSSSDTNHLVVNFAFNLHKLISQTPYFKRSLKILHLSSLTSFPVFEIISRLEVLEELDCGDSMNQTRMRRASETYIKRKFSIEQRLFSKVHCRFQHSLRRLTINREQTIETLGVFNCFKSSLQHLNLRRMVNLGVETKSIEKNDENEHHVLDLKNLKTLSLHRCPSVKASKSLTKCISASLDTLEVLDLSACANSVSEENGHNIFSLGAFISLRKINLSGIEGVTDHTVSAIAENCPILEYLNLTGTKITNKGIEKLAFQHCRCEETSHQKSAVAVRSCLNETLRHLEFSRTSETTSDCFKFLREFDNLEVLAIDFIKLVGLQATNTNNNNNNTGTASSSPDVLKELTNNGDENTLSKLKSLLMGFFFTVSRANPATSMIFTKPETWEILAKGLPSLEFVSFGLPTEMLKTDVVQNGIEEMRRVKNRNVVVV